MSLAFGHFGILMFVLQCFPCGAGTRCTLCVKIKKKKVIVFKATSGFSVREWHKEKDCVFE